MTTIYRQRMTAEMDDDFVVFLIGMRINKPWKIHRWLPVSMAMGKMLQELYASPELGLLHHQAWFARTTLLVQYWESFEKLEHYASNRDSAHLPAWRDFNRRIGSNGDVGIWHETYLVQPGGFESIYHNMPLFGLAKAGNHAPITKATARARQRVGNK